MAERFELTLFPFSGTNLKAVPSNEILVQQKTDQPRAIPGGVAMSIITSDVGGSNWDTNKRSGEIQKCAGELQFSTETFNSTGNMQALDLLYDGTNRNMCGIRNGKFYKVDTDRGVTNIDNATPVTFHTTYPILMCQYGAYFIIPSIGVTPQKWKHGDANLTPLINAGGATAYKFKFVEQFKNCIIGAYSDQTNGNLELRWTDPLPNLSALDFPTANQIYKPDNDLGITGVKRLGNMACLIYGDNSIYSLDYYPDFTPVFAMTEQITGIGPRHQYSIADTGRSHLFFDENKGFIEYSGGKQYEVVSDAIEPLISTMSQNYYQLIYGANISYTDEIAWAVPLNYATANNAILYYNTKTKQWRREDRAADVLGYRNYLITLTWNDLISYRGSTWDLWGNKTWSELIAGSGKVYYGKSDGYVYEVYGDTWAGSNYDAYRVEPIVGSPDYTRHKRLQEIHILGTVDQSFSVDVYWRGGETEQEVIASSWELLGSVSQAAGSSQWIPCDKCKKYHQIKWGTSRINDRFKVSKLILKGYMV